MYAFAAAVVIADPESMVVIDGMFATTYDFEGTTQYGVTFDPEGTDLISALNLAADYLKAGTPGDHYHTYVVAIDANGNPFSDVAAAIKANRAERNEIRRSMANHPSWSGLATGRVDGFDR